MQNRFVLKCRFRACFEFILSTFICCNLFSGVNISILLRVIGSTERRLPFEIDWGTIRKEVIMMDIMKKKQLLEEYKNRMPEMGVISLRCKDTGEAFLGISKDTKADFNSNRFKLLSDGHPNKVMQELWNKYGADSFECSVLKILKYEDPREDHTAELETLREKCMEADPRAKKIWR